VQLAPGREPDGSAIAQGKGALFTGPQVFLHRLLVGAPPSGAVVDTVHFVSSWSG
jgi:hypothetical protein